MKLLYSRYDLEDRIKDLGKAIVFSNSERNELGCPRRWYYSYSESLRTETTSNAVKWGSYFHDIMEKVFTYWRDTDDYLPFDIEGFISPEIANIRLDLDSRGVDPEPVINDLIRALRGWINVYGRKPEKYKVLEVEFPMVCPVITEQEEIYTGDAYVVEDGDYLRLARKGEFSNSENSKAKLVKDWEWYVVGRCDALVEMRDTKELYVIDHKTTGSIQRYESMVEIDPQLISYSAMLMYEKEYGTLQKYKDRDIGGIIYNIVASKTQRDPDFLKKGGLSKAKKMTVPSWFYIAAIKANGLDINDYTDHINWLAVNADPTFYKFLTLPVTSDKIRRWQYESLGIARTINQKHTQIAKCQNIEHLDAVVPRIPVCRMTGYCNYKDICFSDNKISRMTFKQEPRLKWTT